jgi:hypothetical protein
MTFWTTEIWTTEIGNVKHLKLNEKTILTVHIGSENDLLDENTVHINIQPKSWEAGYNITEVHLRSNGELYIRLQKSL